MEHSGDSRAEVPRAGTPASTATDERAEGPAWDEPATTSSGHARRPARAAPERPPGDAPGGADGSDAVPPGRPGTSRSKRALDLVVVLAALPVVVLLGLGIAAVVVITSGGPALFVHERVGLGGRRFGMLKFRTMQPDADDQLRADPELWQQYVDNDFKLPPSMDNRVTPVGRFLRRSSLDELPQLLNVLRGDMSLVGPRPIVPTELERYGDHGDAYLGVRPGVTGAWQVNGRSGVAYPQRVDYDREYVEAWSFWLDVKILVKTPIAVVTSRGAH
jgi:lipopolysaccharide/colanic/teichoic acid biosynthesis glycosyltransferase